MYKFDELLGLFDLTYNIDIEGLKRAKKKVLMLHPDKSKLGPEFFLFYKKAFEIIVQFYESQNKQNQKITEDTTKYTPVTNDWNKATNHKINQVIGEMSKEVFQEKFNDLFEKNMRVEPKKDVNTWFSQNDPLYQIDGDVNANNMGRALDHIKQKNNGMILYRGVQNLSSADKIGAGRLYDDDEEGHEPDYVCSDPFSKLKFDDLRKVHKDQTVFSVSESDFDKVEKYASVDHMNRARGQQVLTPLEKGEAQHILDSQNNKMKQYIMKKEYDDKLKSMSYVEKNKAILSNFLQLKN